MILNAAVAIENNKQEINELNVFPVPDGDTGTNMSLTISAAEKALIAMTPGTLGYVAEVAASAFLRGARGNSGVILSLLFRGLSRRLKDVDKADGILLAEALTAGMESAYKAVMKPAEGTILTVSRVTAAAASEAAKTEKDIEKVLEAALKEGNIALADTVNQNPVLKKAGVVDAGAKGYLYILDGMLRALRGEFLEKIETSMAHADKADFSQFAEEDITFTYCTEFMVQRKSKADTNRLRDFLDGYGDSVVVVDDAEIIKVHIHTDDPGVVLTKALTYGPILTVKIENMRQQHAEAVKREGAPVSPPEPVAPEDMKEFALVVVCAGAGIEEVFRNLGADRIITGGQTMNPSTEDILDKIVSAPSDTVFVLPNNKNIIMAAEQCVSLTEKRVIVIPTTSIPQGVTALLAIDETDNIDDMASQMTTAAKRVRTALVTTAARDSVFDGYEIIEGEYLALFDGALAANGPDTETVIEKIASDFSPLNPEFITIFTGEGINENEAASVAEHISSKVPNAEVTVINGGQPVYYYIISVE